MKVNNTDKKTIFTDKREEYLFSLIQEDSENEYALTQLYLKYRPAIDYALRKYSYLMESFVDPYEYESHCVDTLLSCIKNFNLNSNTKFNTYLQTSLKRTIIKVTDRYHLCGRDSIKDCISLEEPVCKDMPDGLVEIGLRYEYISDGSYEEDERNFDNKLLIDKIEGLLPKRYIDVFKLYVDGNTVYDIAKIYNVSPTYISTMMNTARKFINACKDLGWQVKIRLENGACINKVAKELNINCKQAIYYMRAYNYLYLLGDKPGKRPVGVWRPCEDWVKVKEGK